MKIFGALLIFVALPLILTVGCNINEPLVNEFPQVRITYPTASTKILDFTTIQIEASDDKGVVRVELYIDGRIPPGGVLLYEPYAYFWQSGVLPDSSVHQLVVKAYDTDSNVTTSQPLTVVTYRFTPGFLSATMVADTLVRLTWADNSSIETAYQVLEDVNDSGYAVIQTLPPNTTVTEIKGIFLSQNRYSFKVRALIGQQRSNFTSVQIVSPSLMPPLAFSFANVTDTQIDFTWTRSQFAFESRIEIEEQKKGSGFKIIKTLPGDTTSASLPGSYTVGNLYSYRARSFSKYNASAYSGTISTNIPFPNPEITRITAISSTEVRLEWQYSHTFEKGFAVSRGLLNSGTYTEVGRVGLEFRSWVDNTLDTTKSYSYVVQAITDSNKSSNSYPWSIAYLPNYVAYRVLTGHTNAVNAVAFIPNTSTVIAGSDDNTLTFWNASDGTLLRTIAAQSEGVRSVAVSPDGSTLATGGRNNAITLWNIGSGTVVRTLSGHTGTVNSLVFNPDGSLLVSGSADSTVRLWRVGDGALMRTITGHTASVNTVAITADGSTIASGSDDITLRLWRTADGSLLRVMSDPPLTIQSAAFSPDGFFVACARAGTGNPLIFWKVSDGEKQIEFPWLGDNIYSLAYHSNGKTLVCGYGDKLVRVWEPNTALKSVKLTVQLEGHTDRILSVAVSSDAAYIASGSKDATIRIWQWKKFWQ